MSHQCLYNSLRNCFVAGELRHCARLEELTLENNRLTSVLLNFGDLWRLQVTQNQAVLINSRKCNQLGVIAV